MNYIFFVILIFLCFRKIIDENPGFTENLLLINFVIYALNL